MIESFHWLRPIWLLALPVVLFLWWQLRQREQETELSLVNFAPHLTEALTVGSSTDQGIKPIDTLAVLLILASFALAGPTWRQEPSPWYTEAAPLVIAVEVTDSMRSNDVQPTRLDRVRLKLLELVKQRAGARTALIAYAGSAHVVIPPTVDQEVLKMFLENLDPAMMPTPGQSSAAVLPLAKKLLEQSVHSGSLLFVTDGIDAVDIPQMEAFRSDPKAPEVIFYVVGEEQGGVALYPDGSIARDVGGLPVNTQVDLDGLKRSANRLDIAMIQLLTASNDDVRSLLGEIRASATAADDPNAVWVDEAWWFVWPLLLLSLLSFRRGWV